MTKLTRPVGAHTLLRTSTRWLRAVFAAVIVTLAVEMIYNGLAGRF